MRPPRAAPQGWGFFRRLLPQLGVPALQCPALLLLGRCARLHAPLLPQLASQLAAALPVLVAATEPLTRQASESFLVLSDICMSSGRIKWAAVSRHPHVTFIVDSEKHMATGRIKQAAASTRCSVHPQAALTLLGLLWRACADSPAERAALLKAGRLMEALAPRVAEGSVDGLYAVRDLAASADGAQVTLRRQPELSACACGALRKACGKAARPMSPPDCGGVACQTCARSCAPGQALARAGVVTTLLALLRRLAAKAGAELPASDASGPAAGQSPEPWAPAQASQQASQASQASQQARWAVAVVGGPQRAGAAAEAPLRPVTEGGERAELLAQCVLAAGAP